MSENINGKDRSRFAEALLNIWRRLRSLFVRYGKRNAACRLEKPETSILIARSADGETTAIFVNPGEVETAFLDASQALVFSERPEMLAADSLAKADIVFVGCPRDHKNSKKPGNDEFNRAATHILSAAAYGVPVIFPDFLLCIPELADLHTLGGGLIWTGKESLARNADRLLHDSRERHLRGKWAKEFADETNGIKKIDCHPDNQSSVNLKI